MPTKIFFVGGGFVEVEQDVEEALNAIRADTFASFDLEQYGTNRVYVSRNAISYIQGPVTHDARSF